VDSSVLRPALEADIRMEARVVGVVDNVLDPSVRQEDVVVMKNRETLKTKT